MSIKLILSKQIVIEPKWNTRNYYRNIVVRSNECAMRPNAMASWPTMRLSAKLIARLWHSRPYTRTNKQQPKTPIPHLSPSLNRLPPSRLIYSISQRANAADFSGDSDDSIINAVGFSVAIFSMCTMGVSIAPQFDVTLSFYSIFISFYFFLVYVYTSK